VDLEDFCQIRDDLLFAQHCFGRLSKREYGVVYAGGHSRKWKNDGEFVDWCIFVSGAIYYRRCFMPDARTCIDIKELSSFLSPADLAKHQYLYDVARAHVAHSVNDMELGCTTVSIAQDENVLHRGGLGRQGSSMGPLSPAGAAEASELIEEILVKLVAPKLALLATSVEDTVRAMSDSEILAPPAGSIPRQGTRVDKRRSWPKRKRRN
jgi:hypothetical protein